MSASGLLLSLTLVLSFAASGDDEDLARLTSWFARYRTGQVDASVVGRLIPEQQPPPAFNALERALARIEGTASEERVAALIEVALFRFHPDPATEARVRERQQPWVVRDRVRRQLADYARTEAGARLVAARTTDPDAELRAITVEALVRGLEAGRNQASAARVLAALEDTSPRVRLFAVEGAALVLAPAEARRLVPALEDPLPEIRVRALLSLRDLLARGAQLGMPVDAAEALGARLHDGDAFVRIRAAEVLAEFPASAPRAEVVRALAEELERRDAGLGHDRFLVPLLAAARKLSITREESSRFRSLAERPDLFQELGQKTFAVPRELFGIQFQSDHVVLVLDVSGSMTRAPGSTPDAEGKEKRLLGESRIGLARKEIVRLLSSLTPRDRINLVLFADGHRSLFEDLVPANEANVGRARDLAFMSLPAGKTDLFAGIYHGLRCAGLDHGDRFHSEADTLIILTDGIPTAGAVTDPDDIERILTELNKGSGIRIHVVDLGRRHGVFAGALKRLAERNGGSYARPKGN